MDPITLVITALLSGAASAGQAIAGDTIKEAYTGLKNLIQRKFAGKPEAELALTNHESNPTKWEAPLKTALAQTQVDQDQEIIAAAQKVMQLAQSEQGTMKNYAINFHGPVQGPTTGDHNTITQTFGDITKEK